MSRPARRRSGLASSSPPAKASRAGFFGTGHRQASREARVSKLIERPAPFETRLGHHPSRLGRPKEPTPGARGLLHLGQRDRAQLPMDRREILADRAGPAVVDPLNDLRRVVEERLDPEASNRSSQAPHLVPRLPKPQGQPRRGRRAPPPSSKLVPGPRAAGTAAVSTRRARWPTATGTSARDSVPRPTKPSVSASSDETVKSAWRRQRRQANPPAARAMSNDEQREMDEGHQLPGIVTLSPCLGSKFCPNGASLSR